jgi:hypothetical protein
MGNGVKTKRRVSGRGQPAQKEKNKAAWEARSEVINATRGSGGRALA